MLISCIIDTLIYMQSYEYIFNLPNNLPNIFEKLLQVFDCISI